MLYYTHNLLGSINLVEAMRKHNCRNVRLQPPLCCDGMLALSLLLSRFHCQACEAAVSLAVPRVSCKPPVHGSIVLPCTKTSHSSTASQPFLQPYPPCWPCFPRSTAQAESQPDTLASAWQRLVWGLPGGSTLPLPSHLSQALSSWGNAGKLQLAQGPTHDLVSCTPLSTSLAALTTLARPAEGVQRPSKSSAHSCLACTWCPAALAQCTGVSTTSPSAAIILLPTS